MAKSGGRGRGRRGRRGRRRIVIWSESLLGIPRYARDKSFFT